MIARYVGRGPNGIEDLEVGVQHGTHGARLAGGRLCPEKTGRGHGSGTRHGAFDKRAARRSHWCLLLATLGLQELHCTVFSWLHRFRHGLWYAASTKQGMRRSRGRKNTTATGFGPSLSRCAAGSMNGMALKHAELQRAPCRRLFFLSDPDQPRVSL